MGLVDLHQYHRANNNNGNDADGGSYHFALAWADLLLT
jgi:hypothetical protein